MRATLCWTDPAGSSISTHNSRTPRLVNNLNVKIIAPDNAEYLPFVMPFVGDWTTNTVNSPATTGINNTDNVEQVLIANPAQSGIWRVVVSFTGTLTNNSQVYSLLLSGVDSPTDELAPSPNPMTWANPPAAASDTSITMTATTASDLSGVEYYFTETSGTAGGTDSGWQDSPTYTDSGLFAGTQYTYTVTARDKSNNQNSTTASAPAAATTTGVPDTSPPNPNPASFASFPVASSTTSIIMTATTASDPAGVEYQFTETSGHAGGTSSGWQDSPVYEDTGLTSGTDYSYTVTTRDKSPSQNIGNPSATATAYTTATSGSSDVASADIAVAGTVTGTYTNTQFSDNSYEQLAEIESAGSPATRYSYLEHKWAFTVSGSTNVTFHLEAHHSANSEGDDFTFAYSTTGADGTYTNMLTVTKTTDDNTEQTFALPPGTTGTVHVRVVDTDQTTGRKVLDSLFIDSMYFTSGTATDTLPPTLVSITDNQAGGPIEFNTPVIYTVTFSEDMDASSVTAADFGNAGTATITIGAINESSPGVFSVAVTPTAAGSLQLRVNAGASLLDVPGNAMMTTTAWLDDVVITVTNVIVNVTLGNLNASYDGTPKAVSVVTNPSPVAYTVTYDGLPEVPTDAGSYAVVVTITEPGYEGQASDTLVISPAAVGVTIGGLATTYDGTPKPVSVTTAPPGVAYSVTYNASATAPTNAGTYAVVVTITDPNFTGGDNASLVIAKATQTINFPAIGAVYDNAAPFNLTATVNSPLAVSYANSNPAVVSLSGNTVTVVGLGTTTITVSQAGDANHDAATPVQQSLTVVRAEPLAVTTGPYKVLIGQSLELNASGSFPSYNHTISSYAWDLNDDGTFGDVNGATPAVISFDDLMSVWGMTQGTNTIQLRITDTSGQTSFATTTVQLVLSLQWDANGTGSGQTNGGGAWLGTNLWWDGSANTNWVADSNAVFGGPATNGGSVTLASPTSVNSIIAGTFTGTYTIGTSGQTITTSSIVSNTGSGQLTLISPINNAGTDLTFGGTAAPPAARDQANVNLSGGIMGGGGLVKNTNSVVWIKGGTINYSGNTTINGGILRLQNTGQIGAMPGNLTINSGVAEAYWAETFTRSLGSSSGQVQIIGNASGFSLHGGTTLTVRLNNNTTTPIQWGSTYFNPATLVLQSIYANTGSKIKLENPLDLNGAQRTIQVNKGAALSNVIAELTGTISNSSGTAGLTKTGAGILNLTVAPTYNGNTTVSEGTLKLNVPNTANDSSTVRIAAAATLELNFSGTDTVDRLYIGNYQMNAGVYKAVGSAASGIELAQLTGTGTLTVTSSPTAYGSWTNNYADTLDDPDPAKDGDGGGLDSGLEWVYGGDPTSVTDDTLITPIVDDTDPAVLSCTFRRTDAAATDPQTTITVEYGSNLTGWSPVVPNGNTIIVNTFNDGGGNGVDLVEVRLARSLAVGNKLFTRIKVNVAP